MPGFSFLTKIKYPGNKWYILLFNFEIHKKSDQFIDSLKGCCKCCLHESGVVEIRNREGTFF